MKEQDEGEDEVVGRLTKKEAERFEVNATRSIALHRTFVEFLEHQLETEAALVAAQRALWDEVSDRLGIDLREDGGYRANFKSRVIARTNGDRPRST